MGLHLWGWNLYTVASSPLSPGFVSWMFTLSYSNSPHMTDLFPWDSCSISVVLPKSLKYFLPLCYIENKKRIDIWHWSLRLSPADKEISWLRAVGPDPTWSVLPLSSLYSSDHVGPASLSHHCSPAQHLSWERFDLHLTSSPASPTMPLPMSTGWNAHIVPWASVCGDGLYSFEYRHNHIPFSSEHIIPGCLKDRNLKCVLPEF